MGEIKLKETKESIAPNSAKIIELDGEDLFIAIRDFLQKYRGVVYTNEKTILEVSWRTHTADEISPGKKITAVTRIFDK